MGSSSRYQPGFPSALTQAYLKKYGRDIDGKDWAEATININLLLYWKSQPGDCGSPTQMSSSALQATQGLKLAAAGTGAAGAIGGLAVTGFAASAGGIALGAATLGIGLIALPLSIWAAHKAEAKAKGQSALCQITSAYNGTAPAVEDALISGQITLQQAIDWQNQASNDMLGILSGTSIHQTAGWPDIVKALRDFNNEVRWPAIAKSVAPPPTPPAPAKPVSAPTSGAAGVSNPNQAPPSVGSVKASLLDPNGPNSNKLAIGLAILGAILSGAVSGLFRRK
jgi:hypothetical protein